MVPQILHVRSGPLPQNKLLRNTGAGIPDAFLSSNKQHKIRKLLKENNHM